MKKTYVSGEQTKNSIYAAAKELFYKNGYDDTSFGDIKDITGTDKGLIAYHFKSKYNLAAQIYDEIEKTSYALVADKISGESAVMQEFINLYMFHKLLRENPNYLRFCAQIAYNPEFLQYSITDQYTIIDSLAADTGADFSEGRLHTIATLCSGLDKEIIIGMYTGDITEPIEDVLFMDASFLMSQFGYTQTQIANMTDRIFRIPYTFHMGEAFSVRLCGI